eukprot:CAMPEP_0172640960 /NCGR_PEP_ID=MMETSP1068-20121228/225121_1 /TAXON_ID=35684 /ORGANISM="Pseudopedinella elastica, Strain CCMP716" /LENGTH=354 /DNA_ID=CAMNT_0013454431 /DNA_START=140 /DNA_END=1204 /DNA_ORIENTATION=+
MKKERCGWALLTTEYDQSGEEGVAKMFGDLGLVTGDQAKLLDALQKHEVAADLRPQSKVKKLKHSHAGSLDSCTPLEGSIGNAGLFEEIRKVVRPLFGPNRTLVLLAGQGTTGSRTISTDTATLGIKTVHLSKVALSKPEDGDCNFDLQYWVKQEYANYITKLRIEDPKTSSKTTRLELYEEMARLYVSALNVAVDECGARALGDAFWVSIFAELYYAACPHVQVVLTTRDPGLWAESRIKKHGKSKTGFICPRNSTDVLDRFSQAQCGADGKSFLPALDNGDLSVTELGWVLTGHDRFVRDVTRARPGSLLEFTIFGTDYTNNGPRRALLQSFLSNVDQLGKKNARRGDMAVE